MAQQSLIWTALPNGYTADGSGMRLSVLLSPRLDTQDPTVTHKKLSVFFPDWEDWPKTLSNAKFDVTYNGQTVSMPATTVRRGAIASTIGSASRTRPSGRRCSPGSAGQDLRLQGPGAVGDAVLRRCRDGGRHRGALSRSRAHGRRRLPRVSEIIEDENGGAISSTPSTISISALRGSRHRIARIRGAVRRAPPHGEPSAPVSACSQVSCCSTRRRRRRNAAPRRERTTTGSRRRGSSTSASTCRKREDVAASLEFHQVVAAWARMPTLLRRLGLVVDLILRARRRSRQAAAAACRCASTFRRASEGSTNDRRSPETRTRT